jgi:hypothetical protein
MLRHIGDLLSGHRLLAFSGCIGHATLQLKHSTSAIVSRRGLQLVPQVRRCKVAFAKGEHTDTIVSFMAATSDSSTKVEIPLRDGLQGRL